MNKDNTRESKQAENKKKVYQGREERAGREARIKKRGSRDGKQKEQQLERERKHKTKTKQKIRERNIGIQKE